LRRLREKGPARTTNNLNLKGEVGQRKKGSAGGAWRRSWEGAAFQGGYMVLGGGKWSRMGGPASTLRNIGGSLRGEDAGDTRRTLGGVA